MDKPGASSDDVPTEPKKSFTKKPARSFSFLNDSLDVASTSTFRYHYHHYIMVYLSDLISMSYQQQSDVMNESLS